MKPILFNTQMVRAILEGRKTCTRRALKPHYRNDEIGYRIITNAKTGEYFYTEYIDEWEDETRYMPEPYIPGDILYVRETWNINHTTPHDPEYVYKADHDCSVYPYSEWSWRPSIHMPKDAARIFLRVKAVRAERLQEISTEDIKREGVEAMWLPRTKSGYCCESGEEGCMDLPCPNRDAREWLQYREPFITLWDSTLKPADREEYGWNANPWVWVIEFERITKEEAEHEF
jgi:hypothetical protein